MCLASLNSRWTQYVSLSLVLTIANSWLIEQINAFAWVAFFVSILRIRFDKPWRNTHVRGKADCWFIFVMFLRVTRISIIHTRTKLCSHSYSWEILVDKTRYLHSKFLGLKFSFQLLDYNIHSLGLKFHSEKLSRIMHSDTDNGYRSRLKFINRKKLLVCIESCTIIRASNYADKSLL